jgi:hypothetical protein
MALCAAQVFLTRVDVAYDPVADLDWPNYFTTIWYLPRLVFDIFLCALLIAAAWETSFVSSALGLVGQSLFGTYLIHLYFHPDLNAALLYLGRSIRAPWASVVQCCLIVFAPAAYILTVGWLVQRAVVLLVTTSAAVWSKLAIAAARTRQGIAAAYPGPEGRSSKRVLKQENVNEAIPGPSEIVDNVNEGTDLRSRVRMFLFQS